MEKFPVTVRSRTARMLLGVASVILCTLASAAETPWSPLSDDSPPPDSNPEMVMGGGGMAATPMSLVQDKTGDAASGVTLPAWAAKGLPQPQISQLRPFGANLFEGNFTGTRPDSLAPGYLITPGDRIVVRLWGTQNLDDSQVVDHQGNIFIPEVGPVRVGGRAHGDLFNIVKGRVLSVYPSGVEVYTNLMTAQPLVVYVSGFVRKPGRYAGGASDSLLAFIDRAGGIVAEQGSYRNIRVMRGRNEVAAFDLYEFMLEGILPNFQLMENDVVLIEERGPSVAAIGDLRQPARYEYPPAPRVPGVASFSGFFSGQELMRVASPLESVAHVVVSGSRNGAPFNAYLTRDDFSSFMLADNDVVEFVSDRQSDSLLVTATGEVIGEERFPIKKGTTLVSLLNYIAVNQATADIDAVYLRRRSVAEQQRRSIADGLQRLEQAALTATSSSPGEAEIRVREAAMIQDFVRRASLLEPDGVVVVRRNGLFADIMLEDGDIIVVPPKRDVVQISGEVRMPKVVAYGAGSRINDYINAAGGFTRRSDKRNLMLVRPNGEVLAGRNQIVQKGDHIIVLPRHESKNLMLFKDLSQILYQIAIATKVALDI